MTKRQIILWMLPFLALYCLLVPGADGAKAPDRTVDQAFSGLATHVLKGAKLAKLKKGVLLKSGDLEIQESKLLGIVEKAEPAVKDHLRKNLFFILEQEAIKGILYSAAKRSGILIKDLEEMQAVQAYLDHVVQDAKVPDEETKAFYDENKEMIGGAPYEQVKEGIREILLQKKRDGLMDAHVRDLVTKADIRVNEEWTAAQYPIAMDNPVDKARRSGKPTLVEFGAKGCIPCDMMQPILDKLRKNYPGRLNVVFSHVGENPIMGARFGIRSIPVQVFFDGQGKEVFRHTGFFAEEQIVKQLAEMGIK